jgi:acetolactate synthase small subunit
MQAFQIRYRNTQGTLMRILNAASRRGLDLTSVHAEPAEHDHRVTLTLEVNSKQVGQLFREWYAVADVVDVRSGAGLREHFDPQPHGAEWDAPHRPTSANANGQSARAALA